MYTLNVVVEGTGRGLLMHKFSVAAQADLEKKVKKAGTTGSDPKTEAEDGAYRLEPKEGEEKGQLYLPAEHFLGSAIAAASSFQVKGKGKKTYKDGMKGSIEVLPDYVPLFDGENKPIYHYTIDSRPVKIQRGRIIRHRPHIMAGWRVTLEVQVMDDNISMEVVQAIFEEAGRAKCVGDYRPRYGQFRIASLEKVGGDQPDQK